MTPLRIMVVEDDAQIGKLLVEILAGLSHTCSLQTTEQGAVAAAKRERPQLMIVDMALRIGSGWSTVEAILRGGPMPYILMSGDITRAEAVSPDAVMLQKPFGEASLVRAIERALQRAP